MPMASFSAAIRGRISCVLVDVSCICCKEQSKMRLFRHPSTSYRTGPPAMHGTAMIDTLKRIMVGRPLDTAEQHHQRLRKIVALAVFSSDALSSVAYATEAILFVLVAAGAIALPLV